MGSLKVDVKWQKETFKGVVIDTNESPAVFKSQLFSLTGGHVVGPSLIKNVQCPLSRNLCRSSTFALISALQYVCSREGGLVRMLGHNLLRTPGSQANSFRCVSSRAGTHQAQAPEK